MNWNPNKPQAIGWAQPLTCPVVLGDGRRLETLMDAVNILVALPKAHQLLPGCVKLRADMLQARRTGNPNDIANATLELEKVLQAERLL